MPRGKFDKPDNNNGYFEKMVRAVFVTGFSQKVIDSKWDGFRKVFNNFDVDKVALWSEGDILDASDNPDIIRNFKKIEATVNNAKALQKLIKENGDVHGYLRSLDDMEYEKRVKAISKNFKWFGPKSTQIFLYTVGEHIEM